MDTTNMTEEADFLIDGLPIETVYFVDYEYHEGEIKTVGQLLDFVR
jgi:hypothetical protein